jgi:DNA-binding transcriptional ArsR family regulator
MSGCALAAAWVGPRTAHTILAETACLREMPTAMPPRGTRGRWAVTSWLHRGLQRLRLDVVLVETGHVHAVLTAQRKLNITALQMAVLLQILEHWWEAERAPYPSKETIAHRLDMSARQVQRHIAALEKAGYVRRRERKAVNRGQLSNFYEFDGLVAALKRIEPEVAQAFAESRGSAYAATARGVKPRIGSAAAADSRQAGATAAS